MSLGGLPEWLLSTTVERIFVGWLCRRAATPGLGSGSPSAKLKKSMLDETEGA